MRYACALDSSRVSAVASAISACRPRRRSSVVVGERRSPVLDSRRERALDSSLGGRGRRDESAVTGVPRKPGIGYAVRVCARFISCLSAVASAISALRPRRRSSVVAGLLPLPCCDRHSKRADMSARHSKRADLSAIASAPSTRRLGPALTCCARFDACERRRGRAVFALYWRVRRAHVPSGRRWVGGRGAIEA